MSEQIRKLLDHQPFIPLIVDGVEETAYSIPALDRVWLARTALVIEDDQGLVDIIPYRHIRSVRHASDTPLTV